MDHDKTFHVPEIPTVTTEPSGTLFVLIFKTKPLVILVVQIQCTCSSFLEMSQLDLEVWCFETLPDAPSILGNLAGISV